MIIGEETSMKLKKRVLTVICMLPVLIWIGSLLKCDIYTVLYSNEFDTVYKEYTMIGEIDYLKVLKYNENEATIYYVSNEKMGGDIVEYLKIDNKWVFHKWKTIWSGSGGSASDVIWPYWWHFIYGGF